MQHYLTFQLAGQGYGVPMVTVQEIKGWDKPTRLPHSPAYVQGVVNLRGTLVPILDLRRRLGLGAADCGRDTLVIVVHVDSARGKATAGIVVDAVSEVCSISDQQLRPAPPVGSGIDAELVHGLAVTGDGTLMLLDLARLQIAS